MRRVAHILPAIVLSLALLVPVAARAAITDGLVGYWAFDETSGAAAADSSITGNDGVITGTPDWVTGRQGNALAFDGSTYVTIDRPVQEDFTICAWVKTGGLGNSIWHYGFMQIMDSEVAGAATDFGFGISNSGRFGYGNGQIDFFSSDPTDQSTSIVNNNEWRFGCVSRDLPDGGGNASIKFYVDGDYEKTSTFGNQILDANPVARIGGAQDGGVNFLGSIDEVRAYNRAVSDSEVAELYERGINVDPNAPTSLGSTWLVNGSATSTTQPRLSFTLSDTDSSQLLRYQIQIDDTADFSSAVVDYTFVGQPQGAKSFPVGQSGGSGATYTVGNTGQTLADGSYYWRVRTIDFYNATSTWATANSGAIAFKIDTVAPILTVTNGESVTINAGDTYSDAGATALDGVDGDITGSVQTSGGVDNRVAGAYTMTYSVSDSAGNNATATRTVIVRSSGGGIVGLMGTNDRFTGVGSGYVAPRQQVIHPDGRIEYTDTQAQTVPDPVQVRSAFPTSTLFSRSLTPGMRGEDVKQLQKFLNSNGFPVATSGPGSPGQETTLFGRATRAALINFQEARASEILTPVGLSKGTGSMYSSTMKFINSLLQGNVLAAVSNE